MSLFVVRWSGAPLQTPTSLVTLLDLKDVSKGFDFTVNLSTIVRRFCDVRSDPNRGVTRRVMGARL